LNLEAWLQKIAQQHPQQIELGLDRIAQVAQAMGFVRSAQGFSLGTVAIVVGGTNGKGSTCAMLESILLAAGFRVATYTSPHLIRFNERLGLNGQPASDDQFVSAFERVESAQKGTQLVVSLTYFEFTTLAAFDLIRQE